MRRIGASDVNFYAGLVRSRKRRSAQRARRAARFLPLLLLLFVLLAAALALHTQNRNREGELLRLNAELNEQSADYERARALSERDALLKEQYSGLQMSALVFSMYPQLPKTLFEQVRTCAGDVFTIGVYRYDETTGVLSLDAAADSVNEVPLFVERLRATGLFERVSYAGYTSDTGGTYYCTIDCALRYSAAEQGGIWRS